jgi:23S rRNA pseudouridine1911/1915/1917 synthase
MNKIPDHENVDLIIISENEAGQRLDKILALRYKDIKSRTYFEYLFENGFVLINGNPIKKSLKPCPGDEIEVHFQITPEITIAPESIPLDIIFEDEYLLVVNKPPGMVVHPAVGNWSGTFVNALMFHCKDHMHQFSPPKEGPLIRPGIVHRLDKDTSGLLIAAKQTLVQQRLVSMFASKDIYKVYQAICIGNPGRREIKTLIGRHPVHRQQMAVVEASGKEALTFCHPLLFNDRFSWVEIVLATGRTHQIRVHMAHVGTPVLGDMTYGNIELNKKYKTERQLLHAKRLRFNHPITGVLLELEAPLPQEMLLWIEKIKGK